MWEIKTEIHESGLHYHKERRFTGGFAEVTGVVLRDGQTVLPNRQRKRAHELDTQIRAMTAGEERERLQRQLMGLKAQRRQVEAG